MDRPLLLQRCTNIERCIQARTAGSRVWVLTSYIILYLHASGCVSSMERVCVAQTRESYL